MEEFKGRGGMLTMGWGIGATQSATCEKRLSGHERFENGGSVLGLHPGRGYT